MSKRERKPLPEMTDDREAKRVPKSAEKPVRGYCQRTNCSEWATFHVIDKEDGDVGAYCREDSEFLVRALNRIDPEVLKTVNVQSLFPPL